MTELFDVKDLLTVATANQAEINTKGYFGDNLCNLIENVKLGRVETLTDVIPDVTYCFESNNDLHYVFFLPADRVKNKVKEPVYRPIKTIDELFSFLAPSIANGKGSYSTLDKVGIILCTVFELKDKQLGNICYRRFSQIYLSDNYIRLDEYTLEYLFKNYEIKRDGEFVPFGIKEE